MLRGPVPHCLAGLTIAGLAACGAGDDSGTPSGGAGAVIRGAPDPALAAELQGILDEAVARAEITSALLGVVTADWEWHGASGTVEAGGTELARPGDAFAIHSVTKPFTSVATLRAVEQGLLELDQPLAELVEPEVMAGVHVFEGVDYSDELTIRQALSHRTGLQDVWFDGTSDAQGNSPFMAEILANPDRQWEPADVVRWATEHLEPFAVPGTAYHYSDTNFLLVGLALEAAFGCPLAEIYRTEILTPLDMDHTWLLDREAARSPDGGALTHVYYGDVDLTPMRAMTATYSDGGLASTTPDLFRFLEGVLSGRVLEDPSSLAALQSYEDNDEGSEYGLGWSRFADGMVVLHGHGGTGGARMFFEENFGIYVTSTVNQSATDLELLDPVLTAVITSML